MPKTNKSDADDLTISSRSHKSRRDCYDRQDIKDLLDSVLEGMYGTKRSAGNDDLPESSNRSTRARGGGREKDDSLASFLEKIQKTKRRSGDGLTRRPNRSRRARDAGEEINESLTLSGCRRSFACTGFLIEWNGSTTVLTSASLVRSSSDENRIDENLRIEVLLPNKRRIKGTLQHYSLHYNVALVSVKDCRFVRPANVQHCRFGWSKVASVGRCFKSGALMATGGDLVSWSGTLDCPYIVRSSCKITKTGIGGPLVNLEGEVIGMNFYDTRIGTPFLLWSEIDNILSHFAKISMAGGVGSDDNEIKPAVAFWKMDGDHSDRLSRWPVPAPCWRRRGDVDKEKCDDDELVCYDPQSGRSRRYGYILGVKVELY